MELKDILGMTLSELIEYLQQLDESAEEATEPEVVDELGEERKKVVARISVVEKESREKEAIEKRAKVAAALNIGEKTPNIIDRSEKMELNNRSEILASKEYRNAYLKNLQGVELNEIEKRVYTSAANSGGAAIPTITADTFFDKMKKVAPMLDEITLLRQAGNVKFVIEGVRNAVGLHAEGTEVTPAADTVVSVQLGGYEYMKLIAISATESAMTPDAFEDWLAGMLAEDMGVALENAIINGTGSSQPTGIEAANTWDDTNSVSSSAVTYNKVVELMALVPARYDANSKFLMGKKFFYTQILKIKNSDGDPIVVNDATLSVPYRILGFPVLISDLVADGAAYFGDFKKIVGNLPLGPELASAPNFRSATTDYRALATFDCKCALPDAIVKLVIS